MLCCRSTSLRSADPCRKGPALEQGHANGPAACGDASRPIAGSRWRCGFAPTLLNPQQVAAELEGVNDYEGASDFMHNLLSQGMCSLEGLSRTSPSADAAPSVDARHRALLAGWPYCSSWLGTWPVASQFTFTSRILRRSRPGRSQTKPTARSGPQKNHRPPHGRTHRRALATMPGAVAHDVTRLLPDGLRNDRPGCSLCHSARDRTCPGGCHRREASGCAPLTHPRGISAVVGAAQEVEKHAAAHLHRRRPLPAVDSPTRPVLSPHPAHPAWKRPPVSARVPPPLPTPDPAAAVRLRHGCCDLRHTRPPQAQEGPSQEEDGLPEPAQAARRRRDPSWRRHRPGRSARSSRCARPGVPVRLDTPLVCRRHHCQPPSSCPVCMLRMCVLGRSHPTRTDIT